MKYNIVAGEELKKIMQNTLDNPIPFNENMSKRSYKSIPFSDGFFKERSLVHGVKVDEYLNKMNEFLLFLSKVKENDEVHLYFGEDIVCKANSKVLIDYLKQKVNTIFFHLVNEYEGTELSVVQIK